MNTTAEAPFRLPEQPLESDIVAKYFRGLGDATRMRNALGELLGEPQPKGFQPPGLPALVRFRGQ